MNSINEKSDENFATDFESMLEESLQVPSRGSVIKGIVAHITDTDVLVNIGIKSEGIVSLDEFEKGGEIQVSVGDEVEVMYLGTSGGGGYVKLSRKALFKEHNWLVIEQALESGAAVQVKVTAAVNKGFTAKYEDVECFIPENHIDIKSKLQEPASYVGKVIDVKVLKVNKKQHSFLASAKLQVIKQLEEKKTDFYGSINEGELIKGTVKTIKNYGVFMNFGPVDGFMHKNNISWGVVKHPSQYLSEGDELNVMVLGINRDEDKIEVGLKQTLNDPWITAEEKYPMDSDVRGMIVTRKNKGFVVEIEPGVDGFIPQDELSWLKNDRIKLEPKDMVEGRVVGYDDDNRKVVMSVRLLSENPWVTLKKNHPEGSVVSGKIKSVTDFGLFIDFGVFLDGLVRVKDVSWTDEAINLAEYYKEGDSVDAKILRIDPERERISLGIKQLESNPWKEMGKLLPNGKVTTVKVVETNKEGVLVELPLGLTGFIPAGELEESASELAVGSEIKAVVIKNSIKDRSVLLSVKKYMMDSEKREVKEYLKRLEQDDTSDFSLGSMLKGKIDLSNLE